MVFRKKQIGLMLTAILIIGFFQGYSYRIAYADDRFTSSAKTYTDSVGPITDMEQVANGEYIFAANGADHSNVGEMDADRSLRWLVNYSDGRTIRSISATGDGGVLYAGQAPNPYVIYGKLGNNGVSEVQMKSALNNKSIATPTTIFEVDDSLGQGWMISGHYREILGDTQTPFVLRTDTSGNLTEISLLTAFNDDVSVQDMIPVGDGNYMLAGSIRAGSDPSSPSHAALIQVDAKGELLWSKTYAPSSGYLSIQAIQQTADGGYIMSGNLIDGASGQRIMLIKVAADGTLSWMRDYPLAITSIGTSVHQTADGGYLVGGGNNGGTMLLLKTSASGEQQWDQSWSDDTTGYGNARFVTQLADGSYLLGGGNQRAVVVHMWVGKPKGLTMDDDSNRLIGLDERMEYSLDNGQSFTAVNPDDPPVFTGEQAVTVRYQADPDHGYEVGMEELYNFTADEITEVESIPDIHVAYGTELQNIPLPEQADFILNGTLPAATAVQWDQGSPIYEGSAEGIYTFTGMITVPDGAENPQNLKAQVKVVVDAQVPPTVTDVTYISDIYVPYGSPLAAAGLPAAVKITLDNDSEQVVSVSWDEGAPAYDPATAGAYTFTGTLNLPSGIANPGALTATVKVIVMEHDPNDELVGIILDQPSYRLEAGEAYQTVTTAVYSDGRQEAALEGVQYLSSHPEIASVNTKGLVTGLTPGITEITARYEGFTAKATVEVWQKPTDPTDPTIPTDPETPSEPSNPGTGDRSSSDKDRTPNRAVWFCSQSGGCLVQFNQELSVEVPAGAASSGFTLEINKLEPENGNISESMQLLSSVFELTKNEEGSFLKPITLRFQFQTSTIGTDRRAVLFYYDEAAAKWTEVEGTISGSVLTAKVDHFAKFAVFSVGTEAPAQETPTQEEPTVEESGAPSAVFTDIESHWAADNIRTAVQLHIADGFPDGSFRPEQTVTRAEFTVMLARALGLELSQDTAETAFTDGQALSAWARPAIQQAAAHKLIQGYEDGTFRPNALITRAELITLLMRANGTNADTQAAEAPFADRDSIPTWAEPAAAAAWQLGIVEGRSHGRFEPSEAASRAEAVTLILRMTQP
ncbi:Endoglucanase precursor [compost metagenome]